MPIVAGGRGLSDTGGTDFRGSGQLIFAEAGAGLYEGLYAVREDMPEVYRRLAYDLDRFWESNDGKINWLTRAYTVAASALVVEILSLAALLGDNIF